MKKTQIIRPALPGDVRVAMQNLVHYAWCDERDDYYSKPTEQRPGHIFEALLILRGWLDGEVQQERPEVELLLTRVEGSEL